MKNTLKFLFSKKIFPIVVTLLLIVPITISLAILAFQPNKVVESSSIFIMEQKDTQTKPLYEIKKGESYHIIKEKNNWYKIRDQKNRIGWIPTWTADRSDISSSKDISALISNNLPIYSDPNDPKSQFDEARPNEKIPIQSVKEQWAKITYNGQEGYIDTMLVEVVPSSNTTSSSSDTLEADNAEIGQIKHQQGEIVQVRSPEQYFYKGPAIDTDVLYIIDLNQTFTFINSVEDHLGEELYYVEDNEGQKGYINSRVTAFMSDSDNHQPAIATSLKDAVIMIDPGHGGEDPGAVAEDGVTYEKNIALSTSLALKQALEEKGAIVMMTRYDDQFIEIKDRARMSNQEFADLFISIHYDEIAHEFSGTSTYFYHLEDMPLAKAVNESLMNGPLPNNGIHFGNYQVIRENERPSLLLELGYVSSPNDLKVIQTQEYQQQIAALLTQGIENFLTSNNP